jgi:hypothetical protein
VLTFKDLKKKVSLVTQQQNKFFERLQNKPFWIWNIEEHKQEDIKQTEIAVLIISLVYLARERYN